MVSAKHGKQTLAQGLHAAISYEYADAAARLAATGFTPEDKYKLAFQIDTGGVYVLTDTGSATWETFGSGASGTAGGDLSGTYPNPSVVDLTISGQSQGAILYFDGSNWVVLSPGTDGYVLTTHSTGADPSWTPATTGALASTPPVDVTKASAQTGTSLFAARADHKHDISVGTAVSIGPTNSAGSSTALARADHTHAVVDLNISGQQKGSVLYFDGSNWVVLSNGDDGYVLTAHGIGADPTWTPPTGGAAIAIFAGTQIATSGTVAFINSHGLTFGMSNSNQITASYTVPSTAGLLSAINFSAGTTSNNLSALLFSNSNGLSFGLNGSTITGSYTVPSTAGLLSAINISGGTTSNNLSAFVFSNSNNVSFGLNGSTITASVPSQTSLNYSNQNGISFGIAGSTLTASYTVPTQTNQTEGFYAVGNTTGQSSSSTFDARSISISGAGVASVGYSGGNLIVSVPAGIANINVSAGTTSNNLTNVVFSNSNNVTFGLSGSTVTASISVPAQSNQTAGLYGLGNTTQNSSTTLDVRSLSLNGLGIITVGYSNGSIQLSATQSAQTQNIVVPSAGTQTATSGTVVFSNSNGMTFGMSNSSVITASYTVPSTAGLISNVNVSAGTTSNNLTGFVFSNSNNVSFGLNNGTITATISVPAQTNQTEGMYAVGNTTGQSSSSTFDARTLSISAVGNISAGYSGNALVISGSQSAQTQNVVVPSAGTQTATSGTVVFANSNGLTFGMSGSSQITGSYTVPSIVGLLSAINVSAGTTSNNLSAFTLSNSNGLSFGLNGSVITGSYTVPVQTNQTVGLYALGNTTQNSSTTLDARSLSFNGLGVVTVGYSNGSIQVSVTQSSLSFSNLNGVTFGLNASTLTASVAAQSNQTEGLYAIGNTTGQSSSSTFDARSLSVSGASNISVGYSGNALVISGNNPLMISAGAGSISSGTLVFSNSNGISFGMNAGTITATIIPGAAAGVAAIQAGTQTATSGTVTFGNSNGITFGMSGSSQITASYTVPSTAGLISGVNISAGTTSNNLTNFVFSNSNNVSFGLNGSTVTASMLMTKASHLNWPEAPWQTNFPVSNASMSLQHFNAKASLVANRANLLMALAGNTNSSGALTISLGIYTMNGSTASLASSDSRVITWTSGSQTTASSLYGGVSGTRYRTVSLNNWSVSGGDYLLGMWFRTTNNGTWNAFGIQGPTIVGALDANETNHYLNGYSVSSYSTAMVGSINVTDTNYARTGGDAFQQPGIIFLGTF